jgi:hypothetical protein
MEIRGGSLMRIGVVVLIALGITVFLGATQYMNMDDSLSANSIKATNDMLTTQGADTKPLETSGIITPETPPVTMGTNTVEWMEISEDGVDEDAFLENLDTELLNEIAAEFQSLVEEVHQKQIEDPESVLRGEWIGDITESDRYIKVVNMGARAMKPLYWIIYKSDNQGLYEYICCMALEELSGYDFTDANGIGWATSKEFLDRFNMRIISDGK